MCGIAGYFSPQNKIVSSKDIFVLLNEIKHRGPDDEGYAFIDMQNNRILNCSGNDSDGKIKSILKNIHELEIIPHNMAFGHRRYSVIDLTENAHQPFWDEDYCACLIYNGELYNYIELKKELQSYGISFRTTSDVEVLLKAYLYWGLDCFSKFNGPWALSIFDRRKNELILSRDRLGKNPLYYTIRNGVFYWSSEIKSLLKLKGFGNFDINERAINDYLVYGWRDFGNYTFWKEINILDSASFVKIGWNLDLDSNKFWQLPTNRRTDKETIFHQEKDKFLSLLKNSLDIRKRADVPVAFSLSGGIDSSSLVAINSIMFNERFSVFCVKFEEAHSDEEVFANRVVAKYNNLIDYRVLRPEKFDFWKDVDSFVYMQEEPFHNPNLLTSHNLLKSIKENGFRVVIEGVGGDELLAGYHGDYFPSFLKYLLKSRKYYVFLKELFLSSEQPKSSYFRISLERLFLRKLREGIIAILRKIIKEDSYVQNLNSGPKNISLPEDFTLRMIENMGRWKMNYFLRSENKITFGVPIETRQPFLDYRLIDFAFVLPPVYLIHNGWTKYILREAIKHFLPPEIVWRKRKMGFPFPLREWLLFSKNIIVNMLDKSHCPYLNTKKIKQDFDILTKRDPQRLWRYVSMLLWWQRVVSNSAISF